MGDCNHMKVDCREPKDVLDYFGLKGAQSMQLNIGDYIFENDDLMVIVERKELADAKKSIQDGRWSDQKQRMNDVKTNNDTRVCCIILIEGKRGLGPDPWEQYESNNQSETVLDHAIMNSVILDSIGVIMVQTRKDMIEALEYIGKITKGGFKRRKIGQGYVGSTPKQKVSMDIFRNQLMLIHGVSVECADSVNQVYESMYDLFKDYEQNGGDHVIQKIAHLKKGQRKIGQAVAARIVSSLTGKQSQK
jgi:ERCC4-type nuclease